VKINPEDYAKIKTAAMSVIEKNPDVEQRYKDQGLTPMRLRWDILYASRIKLGDGVGMQGDVNVYAYANDDHIDTALRSVMKEAGLKWAAQLNLKTTSPKP